MSFTTKWTRTSNLPTGNLTLTFFGLMAICERNLPKQFEFLCHGADEHEQRKHGLVVTHNGSPIEGASECSEIEVKVIDKISGLPSVTNPVGVYSPAIDDDRSFNHLIDLEAVYGRVLRKQNPLIRSNRIKINNGVLYSGKLTPHAFALVDTSGSQVMAPRKIAIEMSVIISLSDREEAQIVFRNRGSEKIVKIDDSTVNKVLFSNNCTDDTTFTGHCITSDFPLNYENIINEATILSSDLKEMKNTMTDDKVPCTSTGYGGTEGWNP